MDPDIYFFGFDLTVCEAQGGTGKPDLPVEPRCAGEGIQWYDPGWFFVIKERPGEIGMGLDIPDASVGVEKVKVWNDLSWSHVTPAVPEGEFLQINPATSAVALQPLDLRCRRWSSGPALSSPIPGAEDAAAARPRSQSSRSDRAASSDDRNSSKEGMACHLAGSCGSISDAWTATRTGTW